MTIKHSLSIKEQAIALRESGASMGEIARKLAVPHSTVRSWTHNVSVSKAGVQRLSNLKDNNRALAVAAQRQLRQAILQDIADSAITVVKTVSTDARLEDKKIWCALLFWAEGSKSGSSLTFTNSDPTMIAIFMRLLRECFTIEESKFRILLHLHEYHNEETMKKFWSGITGLSLEQFSRTYWKPHSGKNKREGYKGTARIRYYNVRIAQELTALYNTLANANRGVG